jgi:hypothetical protein
MKHHDGYCTGEEDFSEDEYEEGHFIEKRMKRGYLDAGDWDFNVTRFSVASDCEGEGRGSGYCDMTDTIILQSYWSYKTWK